MRLSDCVYPDLKVARSINLERDRGSASTLEAYQVTNKAREILTRFTSALNGERVTAWSLTGPYGMGKSAFANYLIAITGKSTSDEARLARAKLSKSDAKLESRLVGAVDQISNGQGFFRIPVTAAYEPISRTICSGLNKALGNGQLDRQAKISLQALSAELAQLAAQDYPDSKRVSSAVTAIREVVNHPMIVVVDEFGKNLEYMAHHPDKGDIFIMQVLAETKGVYTWVCLHQSFEAYASGLTAQQRQEWSKVQGRFEDISFVEANSQMLDLARRVLVQKPNRNFSSAVQGWASRIAAEVSEANLRNMPAMTPADIASLYPLHPISAFALPELCRRFAQNDRTLFSFLCSGDPFSVPEYINRSDFDKHLPSIGLDFLYDYFFSLTSTAFANRPEAQRWIEIHDIIEDAHSVSPVSLAILKSVGVLNLLSGPFSLPATKKVLALALCKPLGLDHLVIDKEINRLAKDGVLIYREYAREYRLWEGSDFDVVGAISEKIATLAARPLMETLQQYSPQNPVTASRHSYVKGTVRHFECRWMSAGELLTSAPVAKTGFDGLLAYAVGTQPLQQDAPAACADGRPLLIAYSAHENQIRELAIEAAAAMSVLESAQELAHDGVARKEVRFRIQATEEQLRTYVGQIFAPGSEDVTWYANGRRVEIGSYRALSSILSDLCDKAYSLCPFIGNEMINVDQLSGAAARALREMGEAMIANPSEEQLGMQGFGPEVAVYRSLFQSIGLHARGKDHTWHFRAPDAVKHPQLFAIWAFIGEQLAVTAVEPSGVKVADILARLKQPPFGLRNGPIPLLLCHYLIVNADTTALYQEGGYRPYFGTAEITLMIKRPELFSLRLYAHSNLSREVVQAYMLTLNVDAIKLNSDVRNPSLLRIVLPLLQFVEGLPAYTRYTRRISARAQKLRGAILNSREPIDLLYRAIPAALDIMPLEDGDKVDAFWKDELRIRLQDILSELDSAYGTLNKEVKSAILQAFGYKPGKPTASDFRSTMAQIIRPLVRICRDIELKPVLSAFVSDAGDEIEWIQGIAGQVSKKPLDSWHDSDIDPFLAQITDIANRIENMREFAATSGALLDLSSRVLSSTVADGTIKRQLVIIDERVANDLRKQYANIFEMSEQERAALCALLFDSLRMKE